MSILVIFNGESNSGGQAVNLDLSAAERGQRNAVRILNNTSLVFEPLEIGVNNLLGHDGLGLTTHGWELGLANNANKLIPPIYLVKTGQGGSRISEWNTGGSNYNRFLSRTNEAKQFAISNSINFKPILWYSQGINDAVASPPTEIATWKTATIAHFDKMRLQFPNMPILFSNVTPIYPAFTATIQEICNEYSNCYFISTSGAAQKDANHWSYDGMKLIAARMVDKTASIYSLLSNVNTRPKMLPKFKPKYFYR